ncbi:SURF1 family protein [Curtobacterium flaccumfaciens]|nr:SURF1 family protein [Curtobacterium flaccumfaciens]
MWQWDRRNEAVRQNEQVAQNYDHTPVPLDRALPKASSWQDEQEWLRVSVTGRYDVDSQLLVRNRVHNGQPGFEVLTPLVTSEGRAFIVDRGWVPTGNAQDAPDHVPAPPSGEVTAVVRLQQSEPRIPGRSRPEGHRPGAVGHPGRRGEQGRRPHLDRCVRAARLGVPRPDRGPPARLGSPERRHRAAPELLHPVVPVRRRGLSGSWRT